jgi:hypothetical protein
MLLQLPDTDCPMCVKSSTSDAKASLAAPDLPLVLAGF